MNAVSSYPISLSAAVLCLLSALVIGLDNANGQPPAWSDPANGLAIAGIDPLSYATHGKPLKGSEQFEHHWDGTNWRFVNEGNLAAFVRSPELYAPDFAGFDPFALSQGKIVEGNPFIWIYEDGHLYFFFDIAHRQYWREGGKDMRDKVTKSWPTLMKEIERDF